MTPDQLIPGKIYIFTEHPRDRWRANADRELVCEVNHNNDPGCIVGRTRFISYADDHSYHNGNEHNMSWSKIVLAPDQPVERNAEGLILLPEP